MDTVATTHQVNPKHLELIEDQFALLVRLGTEVGRSFIKGGIALEFDTVMRDVRFYAVSTDGVPHDLWLQLCQLQYRLVEAHIIAKELFEPEYVIHWVDVRSERLGAKAR